MAKWGSVSSTVSALGNPVLALLLVNRLGDCGRWGNRNLRGKSVWMDRRKE